MNRTLLALAVMVAALAASVARADDDCGPRPTRAPQHQSFNDGQYQLQTTQVWVPGQQQQVFVPGECRHFRRHQRCTPGSYQLVMTAGHYETRQEWVWVANSWDQRAPRQYGRQWRSGRHHGAVPVGF